MRRAVVVSFLATLAFLGGVGASSSGTSPEALSPPAPVVDEELVFGPALREAIDLMSVAQPGSFVVRARTGFSVPPMRSGASISSFERIVPRVQQPIVFTGEQLQQIASNEKEAVARLQRLAGGASLFVSSEKPETDSSTGGTELVHGGYRFTMVSLDQQGRRGQSSPKKLESSAKQYFIYAWPDKWDTGRTAFVMDATGDIVANAGTNARGPSGMTAGCACGDRFLGARGSVREALGADHAHGGEWSLVSTAAPRN